MMDKPDKHKKTIFGIIPIQMPKTAVYLCKVALAIGN